MKAKKIYKYNIDDWVIYKPFDFSVPKRAVILWVYDDDRQMYDYEIYIDGEGKYTKVLQSTLFPVDTPTY